MNSGIIKEISMEASVNSVSYVSVGVHTINCLFLKVFLEGFPFLGNALGRLRK